MVVAERAEREVREQVEEHVAVDVDERGALARLVVDDRRAVDRLHVEAAARDLGLHTRTRKRRPHAARRTSAHGKELKRGTVPVEESVQRRGTSRARRIRMALRFVGHGLAGPAVDCRARDVGTRAPASSAGRAPLLGTAGQAVVGVGGRRAHPGRAAPVSTRPRQLGCRCIRPMASSRRGLRPPPSHVLPLVPGRFALSVIGGPVLSMLPERPAHREHRVEGRRASARGSGESLGGMSRRTAPAGRPNEDDPAPSWRRPRDKSRRGQGRPRRRRARPATSRIPQASEPVHVLRCRGRSSPA